MKTKKKFKLKRNVIIAAGLILFAVILVIFLFFRWHQKQMDTLEAELRQQNEAEQQLQAALHELEDKYDLELQEKSSLKQALDEALKKIDEYVAVKTVVIDAEELESAIYNIGELATVEYQYNNVGVINDKKQFSFWNQDIPFTESSVIITMDGSIKAGIDLTQVKIACDDDKKLITVYYPEAAILSNVLDENSLQTVHDSQSIFNMLTQDDQNDLRRQIKEKALSNAIDSDVMTLAEDRAKQMITEIIYAVPNAKQNYEIAFEPIKSE